jgi:hypothetical protein
MRIPFIDSACNKPNAPRVLCDEPQGAPRQVRSGWPSLILCVRHGMCEGSLYAEQEQQKVGGGRIAADSECHCLNGKFH